MELVSILKMLRRRWPLLLPGVPLALLLGLSALYHVSFTSPHLSSRQVMTGAAVGRTLLTMKQAPTFALSTSDVPLTLPQRANMLSNLLAGDELRKEIARRAGVSPRDLAVVGPSAKMPAIAVPIAIEATAAAAPHEPYKVFVTTLDSPPIITVRADAPDPATAARLVLAVRQTMNQALQNQARSDDEIGTMDLGPVQQAMLVDGPSKSLALIAAMLAFAVWCAGVIVITGSFRRLIGPPSPSAGAYQPGEGAAHA
jgi:hypothetical protein